MEGSDEVSGKPRRLRRYLVIGAVVLLVTAGGYGFWLQYPAAMAGSVCAGMLPVDPVLDLSGKSRLSLLGSDFALERRGEKTEHDTLSVHCLAGNADVHIENAGDEYSGDLAFYNFHGEADSFPVPLGGGWNGFISDRDGAASVLLECTNWRPNDGAGILVTISLWEHEPTPDTRRKLVRAVTETARSAAEQTGCAGRFGDEGELASPGGADRITSAAEASGTCSGMTSTPTVRETDAGTSPVEECVLVGGLELIAMYGPYEEAHTDPHRFEDPSGANA
ncbi:hypothetical protein ACH347_33265 [Saccharopolyspora sp. 5N102]|uniref:hypothetical protein n=1 Tax=Saccharopolyspora sp. 5N102 TaxID=3375155 RepID=UPI003787A163